MCFKTKRKKDDKKTFVFRRKNKRLRLKDKTKKISKDLKAPAALPTYTIREDVARRQNLLNKWAYNQIVESIYLYTFVTDKKKNEK